MGRKRIPKNKRREVISISLKPTTIALIDEQISESTPRSQFIETILLDYLRSIGTTELGDNYLIVTYFECENCEKEYSSKKFSKEILCKSCAQFISFSRQEKVILE